MIRSPSHDPWGRDLAGELHELEFESEALAGNPLGDPSTRPLYVYTPPGYPNDGPYPAVWSIQGLTGQIDMWSNRQPYSQTFVEHLDRMIVAGECRPVIVPMPDCWTAYGGSQFLDSAGTGSYMTYLCEELVPWVDERFATIAERDGRAVQGKSSGGYGALVLPMMRPELWGGLGDVSGDAAFEYCYLPDLPLAWAALRDHDSIEEFWEAMLDDPSPSESTFAAVNVIAMAACYSPGPGGEPELPFAREDCSLREQVWERWLELDPVRMIDRHLETLGSMRAISLECGIRDEYRLYAGTAILHRKLEAAGIGHRFELFDGKHGGLTPRYAPLVAWLAERLA
ncbi:MAG TPA: alpha/beta hydrolase-fold protein [Solirubrobacterales bacterium]|nr:alpha/beta hydrolase-fold protein [Solirubrobacterales bacterium]